jgi:hypothetical protein
MLHELLLVRLYQMMDDGRGLYVTRLAIGQVVLRDE